MSTRDFEQKQILFAFLENDEKVSFKNDNIIIQNSDGVTKHQSTCYRLFALFISGHICLTSGLMERAQKFGFTIIFMTYTMRVYAIFPARAEGNVLLRRKQYNYDKFDIAAHVTANKIHNQNLLLKEQRHKSENERKVIQQLSKYEETVLKANQSIHEIMGTEGISAKLYFQTLFADCNWTARRPRVKHDSLNCLMDIGYTLLFNIVDALLEMYGFDTYVGILHREFFHRKSLACDLVEPFRPIVDACLVKAYHLGQIHEEDFSKVEKQYFITGKKAAPYIQMMLQAIIEYKDELFLYVQSYYRNFMQMKSAQNFPVFYLNDREKKNVASQL
jgi:CRISPR-associated protein Cas1